MKSGTIDERDKPAMCTSFRSRFGASLLRVGVLMPTIAAALAGILYIATKQDVWASLLLAAIATILTWLGISLLCTRLMHIEVVNPRSFGLLKSDMALYEPHCNSHCQEEDRPSVEANKSFNYLQEFIRTASGLSWMLETGYITSWEALNRVKEAFMEINPDAVVIGEAFTDWLCIKGSNMPNSELLLKNAAQAARTLAPSAAIFFEESSPPINYSPEPLSASASTVPAISSVSVPSVVQEGSPPPAPTGDPYAQQQARDQAKSILRQVRITLNRYVYNRWEALIHTRNLLLATIAIAGTVIYFLVALAVVTKVSISSLVAGMVFYAVGAISGLFGWLYRGSRIDATVDDYGLVPARLIATPLLSGLAGIGGVIITDVLYGVLIRTSNPSNQTNVAISLATIFSLDPVLIIAAILFGLVPSLLIGTLLKQSHLYVEDLKAVQPSDEGTY